MKVKTPGAVLIGPGQLVTIHSFRFEHQGHPFSERNANLAIMDWAIDQLLTLRSNYVLNVPPEE